MNYLIQYAKSIDVRPLKRCEGEWIANGNLWMIRESDPFHFIAAFSGALMHGFDIVFVDPSMPQNELVELENLYHKNRQILAGPLWLFSTSGSSGERKWCVHTQTTITGAINSYKERFNDKGMVSIIALPLFHVGGFMALMRALAQGIEVVYSDYRTMGSICLEKKGIISLVPTQLKRIIDELDPKYVADKFERIFIGGAAVDEELLNKINDLKLPVVFSYGATETAAMVAASRGLGFGSVKEINYKALPGCHIFIDKEGLIEVSSGSLFKGYLGSEKIDLEVWKSTDRGKIVGKGFSVLGRVDRVIISGGKKISLGKVEALVNEFLGTEGSVAFGMLDPDWGECLHLLVEGVSTDLGLLRDVLSKSLASWEMPKKISKTQKFSRTPLGKIDRASAIRSVVGNKLK